MVLKKSLLLLFFSILIFASIAPLASAGAVLDTAQERKEALQEKREEAKERSQQAKEKAKEKREALKEKMQQKREAAKEKFSAKREALKEKIQTIKNEKKKTVVEKLDTRMAEVNKNRTDRMSEVLEKLTSILDRLSEKGETLKSQEANTAELDIAITQAQSAIQTAKEAVANQSGKEYVITIATEDTLRTTVGTTVSQMQSDLRETHKLVTDAKQAVHNAATQLRKLHKDTRTTTPTATASATQ